MTPLRFITKSAATLLFPVLLALILNCGDDVTDPGGGSGGGNDTTGPNPDVTPPQTITDLSLTYSLEDKAASLEWSAPWDDSLAEAVSRYVIKFTYTDPFIWDLAIPAQNPPVPSAPGETDQYTIYYPLQGRNLYSAIQSVDEKGNTSAISPIVMVHIPGHSVSGQCLHALERLPIEGLAITLATGGLRHTSTGPDGRYAITDLAAGAAAITIASGSSDIPYHTLQYNFELIEDVQRTDYIIPVLPTESTLFDNFLTFFKLLTKSNEASGSTVIKSWKYRPVKCYIPVFVNSKGVDYGHETLKAAQRWMDKSETSLFLFVDQPPDTGIVIRYKSRSQMGIQIAVTHHIRSTDGHPLLDYIDVVNDFSNPDDLYRVMMHELGHTIHFGHLPFQEFIMFMGGNLTADISTDEADAVKLLVSLPSRINMAIYDESYP